MSAAGAGAADEALLPAAARGAVFDLDGTILDTMHHHWEAWSQTAGEYGFAFSAARLLALGGKPTRAIMALLAEEQGLAFDVAAATDRKQDLYVARAHATAPIAPVLALARTAKARGLPVAVATGGARRQVGPALAAAGLEGFFDAVVTADDVAHGKPHPETFLKAAAAIGVAPELCVGYEDAQLGMAAIRAAGYMLAVDVTAMAGYPALIE